MARFTTLTSISVTVSRDDMKTGETFEIHASLGPEGYEQWGEVREVLGGNVDLLSSLSRAAAEHFYNETEEG